MEFSVLTNQEYDAFARKSECRNFLNSEKAFLIKEKAGFSYEFVGVKENEKIIAATGLVYIPTMRKFTYAYAQRGLLVDYQNKEVVTYFTQQLKSYLKSKGVLYLKKDPYVFYQQRNNEGEIVEGGFNNQAIIDQLTSLGYQHQGFTTGFDYDSQCRFMMTLSLDGKDEDTLLKEMDQQTRWSVNKTKKLGIKVKALEDDELDIFKSIMDDTAKRRSFEDMSIDTYRNQRAIYGKENAPIMMSYIDVEETLADIEKERKVEEANAAEIQEMLEKVPNSKKYIKKQRVVKEALDLLDKKSEEMHTLAKTHGNQIPLAVAYFIFYEDELIYVSSGSISSLKKYNGPYAIQWYMIQESIKRGISRYNFYGTSGDFRKEADDYGVFEFKKGFNAVAEELLGDFILPISNAKYQMYKVLKNLKK